MPRYHQIILAYEGECSQCGGCCRNCHRLTKKGRKWFCRDHGGQKPSHCVLFPIGFAVELLPETCTLQPTKLVTVDEVVHSHRINVSGRTSVALFQAAVDDDTTKQAGDPTLYDLQGALEAELQEELYAKTPAEHIDMIASLTESLTDLEKQHEEGPEVPLSWTGARRAQELTKQLLKVVSLYATRRDIILGDLFRE